MNEETLKQRARVLERAHDLGAEALHITGERLWLSHKQGPQGTIVVLAARLHDPGNAESLKQRVQALLNDDGADHAARQHNTQAQ